MHGSIAREEFSSVLRLVGKVVPHNPTRPVLSNVRLTFRQGMQSARVEATDLETAICATVGAQCDADAVVLINAARLTAIVGQCPEDVIQIETDDVAIVSYSGARYVLPLDNPAGFPELAPPESGESIPVQGLTEALRRVVFAATKEHCRYGFDGVLFDGGKEVLYLVATDGRRMATVSLPWTGGKLSGIVPLRAISLLTTLDGEIGVTIGETVAQFQNHAMIICRLVEDRFPDWADVLPKKPSENILTATRSDWPSAIKRAALMTTPESTAVHLAIEDGAVWLSAQSPEAGTARVQLEAEIIGEIPKVAYNPTYLLEGIAAAPSETVSLQIAARRATVIEDGAYRYAVMPVIGPGEDE